MNHQLFFFKKNILNSLPPKERKRFNDILLSLFIPDGKPFFLNSEGLPDHELEEFCDYLISPRRGSTQTWKTYASQIDIFLRFMHAQGKTWKEASRNDLDLYYKVRSTGEFQTGPKLKGRSWNVAKTAIVHLYEYALDAGLIETLPFKYRKSKAQFGSGNIVTADLGAKFTPEQINFIDLNHYKQLWRPALTKDRNAQRNLALNDLLVSTGLRISEALNLQVHQIPDPDNRNYAGRKSIEIRVVGKGKKPRLVRVPKRIIRSIQFYIEEEREEAVKRYREKNEQSKAPSSAVFLSHEGNPFAIRSVQGLFAKKSKITGIKLTPHGCRHTFAIYQLDAMIKRMAANLKELKEGGADVYRQILNDPLRDLQRLLGHSKIITTYIYLDFLEESEALVDESLSDWVNWQDENGR